MPYWVISVSQQKELPRHADGFKNGLFRLARSPPPLPRHPAAPRDSALIPVPSAG
jgi:hypothetical protein